jgi:MFS family permease
VVAICGLRYFPTVAWGVASLAVPLLVFRLSGTAGTVGLYGMISLLAASAAQLATGREIDRGTRGARSAREGSPRRLVPALVATIVVSAVCAAVSHQFLLGLFVGGTLWAMSAWALSTTMPPLIHELGAGRDDGRLVALTHLLWSAGMLSGTFGAGALIDVHPALPFLLAIACLVVTFLIGRRFARMPLPHPIEVHRVQPSVLVPGASA